MTQPRLDILWNCTDKDAILSDDRNVIKWGFSPASTRAWNRFKRRKYSERRAEVMRSALVPIGSRFPTKDVKQGIRELLEAFLVRRSETTRKAYEADLRDFARYLEAESPLMAIGELISQGHGHANSLALHYKGSLIEAGRSPATVNRRLSALRSVISLAKTLGMITWTLEVANEKAQSYRDTRGPGCSGVKAILAEIRGASPKAIRDRVIIRLLYDLALRRGEIASLRLENVDLEARRLWVRGKGRGGEREALTLPEKTVQVLEEWIEVRGKEPGQLFINFDHAGKGNGLTSSAIYYIVRKWGQKAGLKTRPHGIRHAAITEALDRTKDPRAVQRFSRHADLSTVMKYDDNRDDLAGKVAAEVASTL